MKQRKLLNKTIMQFALCVTLLLVLSTPMFYWLTKQFYAEDLIDVIQKVKMGRSIPDIDLEEDVMQGVMIQFALTVTIFGVAAVIVMKFIAARLWRPFNETLERLDSYKIEDGRIPALPQTDIREFANLNETLTRLMRNSTNSYKTQKEFTENASHELQTPLAVFQSKLDLLLQDQNLTQRQADIMQSLYQAVTRLSHLNKNLLLLARIDNSQYANMVEINVESMLKEVLPMLKTVAGNISIKTDFKQRDLTIQGNKTLFESLINNLVINAVRHNRSDGDIILTISGNTLSVENTSDEAALDPNLIFNRFYHPSEKTKGNGLGLAIVKAICDYHGWRIFYKYHEGRHVFTVVF